MIAAAVFAALLRLSDPQRIAESVTVTASAEERLALSATATALSRDALRASPSLTLDQKLAAVPGFSLFRRASSRTANPTTQGVTLRGLSASGASRGLVLADDLPLHDPFGGWVYWNRVPAAAIERVEVARGGSSDLFGSDALGGAVRIVTRRDAIAELRADGGSQRTGRVSAYAGSRYGPPVRVWGAVERFATDGYVPVAPESRGPADTSASSRHTSGLLRLSASPGPVTADAGAGWLSETRHNGTALQTNATATGAGSLSVRGRRWQAGADAQRQRYDQTFSSITARRSIEMLTALQAVESSSAGAQGRWYAHIGAMSASFSVAARQTDATLAESRVAANVVQPATITLARQRSGAVAAGGLWRSAAGTVTIDAGLRGELWSSADRRVPAERQRQGFLAPRLSAAWRPSAPLTLRATAFSSYRAPTMNELYRGFRVGDVMTLNNPALRAERATGAEGALTFRARPSTTMRLAGFVSRLDGAIYSRTLSVMPALISRIRTNGDARAAGIEIEVDSRAHRRAWFWLGATALHSAFTGGELEGNRLPQVPRAQAAAGLQIFAGLFSGSLEARHVTRQFDDDRNLFELGSGTVLNGQMSARLRQTQLFAAVENMFNADIDAGRTPLRTRAQPRLWQLGLRVFSR